MNERLQELLDAVQRTASQVGGSAADAAYGMGKRAGELLSVAKLNIRIMDLKGAVSTALREVGEMIYATHTGTLTEFADEIDGWVIDALKAAGCDTAKSVLELPVEEIAARADLELEQAQKVVEILKAEFE